MVIVVSFAMVGDAVLPVVALLVFNGLFLACASWMLADFQITGWRSFVIHTTVTALTTYLTGHVEPPKLD